MNKKVFYNGNVFYWIKENKWISCQMNKRGVNLQPYHDIKIQLYIHHKIGYSTHIRKH
jgi:hypothetical protein